MQLDRCAGPCWPTEPVCVSRWNATSGPTGGYLVGFILGAYVIGTVARTRQNPRVFRLCLSVALGYVVVYAAGIAQLSIVAHLTLKKALLVGALPFVPGDVLKCAVAALLALMEGSKVQQKNMLDTWTDTGVGVVVDPDGTVFATQIFGTKSMSQMGMRQRFNQF